MWLVMCGVQFAACCVPREAGTGMQELGTHCFASLTPCLTQDLNTRRTHPQRVFQLGVGGGMKVGGWDRLDQSKIGSGCVGTTGKLIAAGRSWQRQQVRRDGRAWMRVAAHVWRTHTHTHTHTHAHAHTRTRTHTHTHMPALPPARTHALSRTHAHTNVYALFLFLA